MPPTFTPNSDALLETAIAARALTQLNLVTIYPRVASRNYEPGSFDRGDSVKIRRPKRREATDLDPRTASYTFQEAQFFAGEVTLERLFVDGFLIYGYDPGQTMELYLQETASMIVDAIATPVDRYLYSKFFDWSNVVSDMASGNYYLGDTPPFAISSCLDDDGNLTDFNNQGLIGASVFLDRENATTDRFAVISASAKGAFLGDTIAVEGARLDAQRDPTSGLVVSGINQGRFVQRYGFSVAGSNTVSGQSAVLDLDTTAGTQSTLPIASVADNPELFYADYATGSLSSIGAVDITLTAATALTAGVAVGKIAKLTQASPKKETTFFGVILRINTSTPTAPVVTLVPYKYNGNKVDSTDILVGDHVFSIPTIPSLNTVNTTEGIIYANRRIAEPIPGSGAIAASLTDPQTALTLQVFTGNYDLGTVSQKNAAYHLCGAKISDCRKTGLILSL